MTFQISALPAEAFAPLFALDAGALERLGAVRRRVDREAGFPCRVSLADAQLGEEVLLLNYEHQPAPGPFRARHAIYVRPGVATATPALDETPEAMRRRTLSLRGFDLDGLMVGAELVDGEHLAAAAARLFADGRVAYLHAHYAAMGCYAARIDRAG